MNKIEIVTSVGFSFHIPSLLRRVTRIVFEEVTFMANVYSTFVRDQTLKVSLPSLVACHSEGT
jgi:hypothetical protein